MQEILTIHNDRCISCFKCTRYCPVNSIVVKDSKAFVDEKSCIACGECYSVCPAGAKIIASDLGQVRELIRLGYKVVASVDSTILAYLEKNSYKKFVASLKELGFFGIEEMSMASKFIREEYENYVLNHFEKGKKNVFIYSYCNAADYLMSKYYGKLDKNIIPIQSPMIVHAKYLKKKYKQEIKVVHISPCISRKYEILEEDNLGIVDKILTFKELLSWIKSKNFDMEALEECEFDNISMDSGLLFYKKTSPKIEAKGLYQVSINGFKQISDFLQSVEKDELSDIVAQIGFCIQGCSGNNFIKSDKGIIFKEKRIRDFGKENIKESCFECEEIYKTLELKKKIKNRKIERSMPSEIEIRMALLDMGKKTKKDEIDCEVCGYKSCREHAIAMCLGLSEAHTCLFYIKDKFKNLNNIIFDISPNYIIVVDEKFKILDANISLLRVWQKSREEVIGAYVGDYLDIKDFVQVLYSKEDITGKKISWQNYSKELHENIIYSEGSNVVIGIFNDNTMEENQKKKLAQIKLNTINTTQDIIEKQMRVAQEIASLLGETTAETKITLTKLKDLAMQEEEYF